MIVNLILADYALPDIASHHELMIIRRCVTEPNKCPQDRRMLWVPRRGAASIEKQLLDFLEIATTTLRQHSAPPTTVD